MVRAGLGGGWDCLFANDFDFKKSQTYENNWGIGTLKTVDVRAISTADLPGHCDLAWASFPCQDLSLAGGGAGLAGERSGSFRPFWRLMQALVNEDRAPQMIVLENVTGTLTSHEGKDFATICSAISDAGYRCGAMVIDANLFVPQSRPRLFVIAVRSDIDLPAEVYKADPSPIWHTPRLRTAVERLPRMIRNMWVWWTVPKPPPRGVRLVDIIEEEPESVKWHAPLETQRILGMMSSVNLAKVEAARREGRQVVGTVYKRTRRDENGVKVQRAEVRFDGIAGCLLTPSGGSSRQVIMVVQGETVRSRLISSRETARLMGLPEDYVLPKHYNEAYHLTGDGVVVPVVRHLRVNLLEPIVDVKRKSLTSEAAA